MRRLVLTLAVLGIALALARWGRFVPSSMPATRGGVAPPRLESSLPRVQVPRLELPRQRAQQDAETVRISEVRISEVCAANRSVVLDDVGETSDWIELHNPTAAPIDLGGSSLELASAERTSPWVLPSVVLESGGYLLVWASGEGRHGLDAEQVVRAADLSLEQSLIREGDVWRYRIGDGRNVPPAWREFDFDDSDWRTGASGFGYADGDDATRVPEGTTSVFIRRSFELVDLSRVGQLVLRIDYDDGFVAYLNGVRIASSHSPVEHPVPGTIATEKREAGRRELHDLRQYVGSLRLGRNVLAVVGLNDSPSTDMSLIPELGTLPTVCHTDFRLPASGGELTLRDAKGELVDRLRWLQLEADRSWGRASEGEAPPTEGWFVTPTPGEANLTRRWSSLPTGEPSFDPLPGVDPKARRVRVSLVEASADVTLGLCTDGRAPDASDGVRERILRLDRDLVVRAASFVGSERLSPVVAATYLAQPPQHLPVLSVQLDPAEFRRVQLGVSEHGRGAEASAWLEVFLPGGERVASTGVGLRLHGGYGRRGGFSTKKSYRLYFRKLYGSAHLGHQLIPRATLEAHRRLVLRANYNDRLGAYSASASFVRDQVLRDLHSAMGFPAAAGTWCLLRINLDYRGIYNVVERIDESFLRRRFALGDTGQWDVVKHGNEVVCGTRDSWAKLRRLIDGDALGRAPTLEELEREVDLENFTAYTLLNLWAQNQDWPQNNWYAARWRGDDNAEGGDDEAPQKPAGAGSRWVFFCWDAEWGMGLNPSGWRADSFRFIVGKKGRIRDLFVELWKHREYRERFREAARAALAGPLSPENVEATVRRHFEQLRPVIEDELETLAPRYSVARWVQNVQVVHDFARRRQSVFRRLVERVSQGPLE